MKLTIDCQKRPAASKPNALRRSGLIPVVLYGHNGLESLELTVEAKAAEFLVRDASVKKTVIQVNVPDLSWSGKAYLQEVQAHPATRVLYHLSFLAVAA
jgi:large subunit ribosomal protein L25